MKAKRLTIKNIGPIADMVVEINQPLILFYGDVRAGKTTVLNAVRWVFGGTFPSDIIRHGETEASIFFELDCGSVLREFYVGRDGTTKAREIVFKQGDIQAANPVKELKKFLNPFLLNQDYLRDMTEPERKRYFLEVLGVDTTAIDAELVRMENEASALRAKLSGYGEVDLTVQLPVDVGMLERKRAAIQLVHDVAQTERREKRDRLVAQYKIEVTRVRNENELARKRREQRAEAMRENECSGQRIMILEAEIDAIRARIQQRNAWLTGNPELLEFSEPGPSVEAALLDSQLQTLRPNFQEVDAELVAASAQNVRAEQYQKNLARQQQKQADEERLHSLNVSLNAIRGKRVAYLESIGVACPIPGLLFDSKGNLTYEGTHAGMLSTSQVMKLSSALSALYPEGFGLDLIDRGESLGKSVFNFVEKARKEDKTILCTIVGEKPATVPQDVGVFVVENGGIK